VAARRPDGGGAWIREGSVLVSRVRRTPGLTATPLDALAAVVCVAAGEGGRVALLGLGPGGLLAPLRALGFRGTVDAVDVRDDGAGLLGELGPELARGVRLEAAEAVPWLERARSRYDAVVDDLAVHDGNEPRKPFESIGAVPRLAAARLRATGVFVTNVLPWPGAPMRAVLGNLAVPFARAFDVRFEDYENRLLVGTGPGVARGARAWSAEVRRRLRKAGARSAGAAWRTLRAR